MEVWKQRAGRSPGMSPSTQDIVSKQHPSKTLLPAVSEESKVGGSCRQLGAATPALMLASSPGAFPHHPSPSAGAVTLPKTDPTDNQGPFTGQNSVGWLRHTAPPSLWGRSPAGPGDPQPGGPLAVESWASLAAEGAAAGHPTAPPFPGQNIHSRLEESAGALRNS